MSGQREGTRSEREVDAMRARYLDDFTQLPVLEAQLAFVNLGDNSGGNAAAALVAVPPVNGSGATTAQEAAINDNFASVSDQLDLLNGALPANRQLVVDGVNSATGTIAATEKGGVLLDTANATGDQMGLRPLAGGRLDQGVESQLAGRNSWVIETKSVITTMRFKVGLGGPIAAALARDAYECFFYYEAGANGGALMCGVTINSVETIRTTGYLVAAATFYRLSVEIDPVTRIPRFFVSIDGGDDVRVGQDGDRGVFPAQTAGIILKVSAAVQTDADVVRQLAIHGLSTGENLHLAAALQLPNA